MAGKMKDFFDRTFYPAQGLPRAGLPVAGVGGYGWAGGIHSMRRIATGYGWKEVLPPVLVRGEPAAAHLAAAAERAE
jgi:hypothetical protein